MIKNSLDKQYIELVNKIIEKGNFKKDRTGTGTLSLFGNEITHNMEDGFPLLTTKKMAWKSIVSELIWFLRGETNIKWLLENNNFIWVGDAYKNYLKHLDGLNNGLDAISGYIKDGWIIDEHGNNDKYFSNPSFYNYRPLIQEEFIKKIKTDNEFAKNFGELGKIYGHQWRKWGNKRILRRFNNKLIPYSKYENDGIDQIATVIHTLKNDPDSRRIMVSAWNVSDLDDMVLPPCHYGFQFYSRELTLDERCKLAFFAPFDLRHGRKEFVWDEYTIELAENWLKEHNPELPTRTLSLKWNQRSVDTGLGLPFNIASYAILLEILCKILNMKSELLIGSLGDTHLYMNHVELIKEQSKKIGYNLPKLVLSGVFNNIKSYWIDGVFDFNNFIQDLNIDDIKIIDYNSEEKLNLPLSN